MTTSHRRWFPLGPRTLFAVATVLVVAGLLAWAYPAGLAFAAILGVIVAMDSFGLGFPRRLTRPRKPD